MISDSLLEEFVSLHPDDLQRRQTEVFDKARNSTEEDAVAQLRADLDAVLKERTNATAQS